MMAWEYQAITEQMTELMLSDQIISHLIGLMLMADHLIILRIGMDRDCSMRIMSVDMMMTLILEGFEELKAEPFMWDQEEKTILWDWETVVVWMSSQEDIFQE